MNIKKSKICALAGLSVLIFMGAVVKLIAEQDVQTLLVSFQSKDIQRRMSAFREISDVSGWGGALGTPTADYFRIKTKYRTDAGIKKALFKLAEMELKESEQLIPKLREEQKEGYGDYKHALFATIGNMQELEGVPYLLSYGGPDVLEKVADVGEVALPQVLDKMYKGKKKLDKYAATVVLVALLEKEPRLKKYSIKSKNDIRKALIYVMNETNDNSAASMALYGFKELAVQGDTETLKMVEKFATEDNRTYVTSARRGNKTTYPIREEAQKVLGELKEKGIYKIKLQSNTTQQNGLQ